ncbi:alpha/beta-hydrolase [Mycena filopes]|nr:alpha/beta-hydrolase [Mycena filopes]
MSSKAGHNPNVFTTMHPSPHPHSRLSSPASFPRLVLGVFILTFVFINCNKLAATGTEYQGIGPFYHNISSVEGVCPSVKNSTVSYAGHIGLVGDTDTSPKRSFFWYFEAENNASSAPVILTIGGGPGTSGLMNPLIGQSPCIATPNGLLPNPHRWTEHHNLIALDHPIGAGFSYGSHVTNSRAAAHDVYDFLQKFFILFPHLARNKFILSGGSYGGVYIPHIATVIQEGNLLLQRERGRPGSMSIPINLEALMLSNPASDPMAHFRWLLQYRCIYHEVYNSSTCKALYSELPTCLESVEMAFKIPTVENRVRSWEICDHLNSGDTHGTVFEDIRRTCTPDSDAPDACHPQFGWVDHILRNESVKAALGVPYGLEFVPLSADLWNEFIAAGDFVQQHHLLFPPLLAAGIRVLHYVGAQDANCAWPGIFSFLKLIESPFQAEFISAPDLPWPSEDIATVRSVGTGAGNMTYILIREAGHFVVHDQPALVKLVAERWIANEPFLDRSVTC